MTEFELLKSKVRKNLVFKYPGNPDDEDGENDRIWINKNQKYEVVFAIAECLKICNAEEFADNAMFIRSLEKKIHMMDHDGKGRCKRIEAYPELQKAINVKKIIARFMTHQ